jgi:phosphatidylinositol-3-phosphatase
VLIVMEENKGYSSTLGACSTDPYLCSLAAGYASANSWWGVTHPSEPNYVAYASGATQGCLTDTSCAANSQSATDLGGQLTAKNVPWIGWMESMPSPCYTGAGSSGYALKHNPFGFFKDNYVGTCHIQPYPGIASALSTLNSPNAPDLVWISPNLTNDMHDGTVQQGDAWLTANVAPILASSWFTKYPSTVIITMDEGDGSTNSGSCCGGSGAGGHIPMVVISNNSKGKGSLALTGDNYGTLRTIEEAFGLSLLGAASSSANGDLSSLFG